MRLGFRQVSGFAEDHALRIESVRGRGFDSVRDLWLRTKLPPAATISMNAFVPSFISTAHLSLERSRRSR